MVGTLEESKIIQVINRLEDACVLLTEVNKKDNRFNDKFTTICSELEKYQAQLKEIQEKLNIENLGIRRIATREF